MSVGVVLGRQLPLMVPPDPELRLAAGEVHEAQHRRSSPAHARTARTTIGADADPSFPTTCTSSA